MRNRHATNRGFIVIVTHGNNLDTVKVNIDLDCKVACRFMRSQVAIYICSQIRAYTHEGYTHIYC